MKKLEEKVLEFKAATSAFENSPAMLLSGPKCKKNQAISDTYFQLREELVATGLALDVLNKKWTPVEILLFRWAVWNQAASHTARITLNSHSRSDIDDGSDAVLIMERVAAATKQLFASV